MPCEVKLVLLIGPLQSVQFKYKMQNDFIDTGIQGPIPALTVNGGQNNRVFLKISPLDYIMDAQ